MSGKPDRGLSGGTPVRSRSEYDALPKYVRDMIDRMSRFTEKHPKHPPWEHLVEFSRQQIERRERGIE